MWLRYLPVSPAMALDEETIHQIIPAHVKLKGSGGERWTKEQLAAPALQGLQTGQQTMITVA